MLEMKFNPSEIENFIKIYYKENEDADVNVSLKNGYAFVRSEKGQRNLDLSGICEALSAYFESQNLRIELDFTNDVELPILIKATQMKRSDVKRLVQAA